MFSCERRNSPTVGSSVTAVGPYASYTYDAVYRLVQATGREHIGQAARVDQSDPPINPLRGVARIITSKKNYERIWAMAPSPYNGATFCQANFLLMKEDVYALAKEWCNKNKIFFVHFRDVAGDANKFHETFHDNGPTNMARILKIYSDGGFDGPMPDVDV